VQSLAGHNYTDLFCVGESERSRHSQSYGGSFQQPLVLPYARKTQKMYNTYQSIEAISPAFAKAVKAAKQTVETTREAAIASEVKLAQKCQEFGAGLSDVRQNRMQRVLPSHAVILGDLSHDLNLRGQSVLNAERALDTVCQEALLIQAVRLQVAERLNELSNVISNADGVINNSISEISQIEKGLQASRKVQDQLRFARQGRNSLISGHQGSTPPVSEVADKAKSFAQLLASTEKVTA
jgi:hypothetical protein